MVTESRRGSRGESADPKARRRKSRHRAQYPTPELYYFSLLLNLSALVIPALVIPNNPTDLNLIITGLCGGVGLILALYSLAIRPRESNRKQRKILVAVTLVYGFVMLVINSINIITNPGAFIP